MQINTFSSYHPEHEALYQEMLDMTSVITYPGHEKWYRETFLPGLKKGERMYVVATDDGGKLAGCVLIKNTADEKKICTLFVDPDFRKRGVARELMEASLKELGEHPLITVSSRNLNQLNPLLKHFRFHLSASRQGAYGKGDTEYYFNDRKTERAIRNTISATGRRKGLYEILFQRPEGGFNQGRPDPVLLRRMKKLGEK